MARILHLVAYDHRRGAETFACELAEHFRGSGHDVRVVALASSESDRPLPIEVAGTSRRDPRGMARVGSAVRWSEVVVSFGSTSLLVGAAMARAFGRPFLYRTIGDPSVWGRVRFADVRIGAPARSAARVIALYPGSAQEFARRHHVPERRIAVIPRGVPAERFVPASTGEATAARAALGLAEDRRWLALVGALSAEKDPLLAVETVRALPDDVGLVVAGDGPLAAETRETAGDLGDRVRFLGVTDDVATVYAATDALILPSRTEGVPGAAIEASLSGLPVVATDVGGVASVVIDEVTGRVLGSPTGAELAEAALDAFDHREQWGEAARRHALARFTMDVVGRRWDELLRTVLAESRQRRTSA